jgi:acyl carrier protein
MTNREKYDAIFCEIFELDQTDLNDQLEYQSIPAWDSVGHMSLMAELEDSFDISLEMDDVIEFGTYATGITTLRKYGVDI